MYLRIVLQINNFLIEATSIDFQINGFDSSRPHCDNLPIYFKFSDVCVMQINTQIRARVRNLPDNIPDTATRRHVIHEHRLVGPVTTPTALKFQTVIYLPMVFQPSSSHALGNPPLCLTGLSAVVCDKNQYFVKTGSSSRTMRNSRSYCKFVPLQNIVNICMQYYI